MKTYYYEVKDKDTGGEFKAPNDQTALEESKKINNLELLYRESDSPDGLPFVILFETR